MSKKRVGIAGLGIMGFAMAINAKKAGYEVTVTNRSDKRKEATEAGLAWVATPREMADAVDVVITMVKDPDAVRSLLTGKQGILNANIKGKTLIQMSTLDEPSTLEFAQMAADKGMKFLDSPVAGSKAQVTQAQLILLAGGDDQVLDDNRELLLSMGKAIVHAGEIGKGTALKLCMNLVVAQMTTALCESVALAQAQEIDPKKIFEVIGHSPALNCGYFQIKEKTLLEKNFTPAFSLSNMLKDVRFMTTVAKKKRIPLPVTQAVQFLMESAASAGLGEKDLTSIVEVLKKAT